LRKLTIGLLLVLVILPLYVGQLLRTVEAAPATVQVQINCTFTGAGSLTFSVEFFKGVTSLGTTVLICSNVSPSPSTTLSLTDTPDFFSWTITAGVCDGSGGTGVPGSDGGSCGGPTTWTITVTSGGTSLTITHDYRDSPRSEIYGTS
jgi:hypothetical protein